MATGSVTTGVPGAIAVEAAGFMPFTPLHAVSVAVCFGSIAVLCLVGSKAAWHARVTASWAGFIAGTQVVAVLFWCWPSRFDLQNSLPLQVCDLVVLLAPFALLTRGAWSRALLYFWGIGLSTQAFATPVLTKGPDHAEFWLFWLGHTQIVGSAIYDAVCRSYRPRLADLYRAVAALIGLGLLVLGFNLLTDTNYWYIGRTLPQQRTVLHELPAWPWRIPIIVSLAVLAMTAAWAPWALVRRLRGRRDAREPSATIAR